MASLGRPSTSSSIVDAAKAALFVRAALVLFAGELVHRRVLHDLFSGDLPCFLNNPGKGPVLPGRLLLDLAQHFLGEVETLFTLIRTGHGASRRRCARK